MAVDQRATELQNSSIIKDEADEVERPNFSKKTLIVTSLDVSNQIK